MFYCVDAIEGIIVRLVPAAGEAPAPAIEVPLEAFVTPPKENDIVQQQDGRFVPREQTTKQAKQAAKEKLQRLLQRTQPPQES